MFKPGNEFRWRSQSAFVLIAAGATLSLNDFLTFPVLVGQNGGGAFLLLYILFLLLMGVPLLVGELLIGRLGRQDPVGSLEILAKRNNASMSWKSIGFISMLAAFLIVATFSVVAGWSLSYLLKFALGIWIFGLGVIFSYNIWNDQGFTLALFFEDEAVRLVKNAGFNDIVIFLSSRLIQPFAALMLCLFIAWVIPRQISYRRLGPGRRGWFEIWNYMVRYVTPVLLLVVTLGSIGVI